MALTNTPEIISVPRRDLSEADRDGFSSTRSPNEHLVIWIQERKFDDRPNPIVVNQSVEHSVG